MPVHDRAADRQPHAEPARLRRIEGLEEAGHFGLTEPDPGVLDRDDRPRAIVTVLDGRADDDPTPLPRNLSGGFDRIHQQVQENLLELDPITLDPRQVRRRGRLEDDSVLLHFGTNEREHVADDTGEVAGMVGDRRSRQ